MSVSMDPASATVGFVGLGIMGLPMARNLVGAGWAVRAHNRSREPVEALREDGATAVSSPAEAADGADVVVTVLPASAEVEEVVLGPRGVAEALRPGGVLVDMSTIDPATARRVAADLAGRGIAAVDAPVSGGQQGAIDGTLAIMAGGEPDAVALCRPLLEVLGASVSHVGGPGAGQVAKAANQVIVAGTIQAVGEALTLAARMGVDPGRVREAISGGFAGSRVLEVHGQRMIAGDYEPGFKAVLHRKDLGIALAAAADAGAPVPQTALVHQLLTALVARGEGGLDSSALAAVLEDLGGGPAER